MAGKSVKTRNTIQTQLRPSPQATTTASSDPPTPAESVPSQAGLDVAALKFELLASLRAEIADIFKKELQATLGDALSTIQLDLQTVKAQLAKDKADTDANVATLKGTVVEMENALSECTDDIVQMKSAIEHLTASVAKLENKCEDLESRSRLHHCCSCHAKGSVRVGKGAAFGPVPPDSST